jgi:hypothetical protein
LEVSQEAVGSAVLVDVLVPIILVVQLLQTLTVLVETMTVIATLVTGLIPIADITTVVRTGGTTIAE